MVGVSYDPKIDRFLDSIGEASAADLENITVARMMEEVRRKWQAREEFRKKNAVLLLDLRRLAFRNAELALEILGRKPVGNSTDGASD